MKTSPTEDERVSDAELAALLGGVDPDEPLHRNTWRLIERALTEFQSLRSAQPDRASIVEECDRPQEENVVRLRDLVYRLSDALTDEGPEWSNEGIANLRADCAWALPNVEWLQPYFTSPPRKEP